MRGESMKDKSKKSTYSTTFGIDPFYIVGTLYSGAFLSAVFFAALPPGIYPASVRSNVSTQRVLPFICGVKRIFGACKRVNKRVDLWNGPPYFIVQFGEVCFLQSECFGMPNFLLRLFSTEICLYEK